MNNLINFIIKAKALKSSSPTPMDTSMPLASPNSTKKGQQLESKALQQTDEILNSILPPRLNYTLIDSLLNIARI